MSEEALTAVRAAERAADMTGRPFCVYVNRDGSLSVAEYNAARIDDILETVHPAPVKDPLEMLPL